MTLHPFVFAYGQRRGYAMAELNRLLASQEASIFTPSTSASDVDGSSSHLLASDLTLNSADPSAYVKELHLFASFYKSLPAPTRRRLRSDVDGVVSFFNQKVSQFGHPPETLSSVLEDFRFSEDPDDVQSGHTDRPGDETVDIGNLLKKFLIEFRTPLLHEYFRLETKLFATSASPDQDAPSEPSEAVPAEEDQEELEPEEEDDGVEDPPWWKKDVQIPVQEEEDEPNNAPELDSILDEIRDVCSKLRNTESSGENSSFPFSMKMYAFSSSQNVSRNRHHNRPAAVCADLTSDGSLACFGCDGDSSIRVFPLRRPGSAFGMTSSSDDNPIVLRAATSSGIVYRLGILDRGLDSPFLLATSDDYARPIQLFDLTSSTKIYDYRGHQWPVWALDVTERGGGMFITGSYDRTARFFVLDRKDPLRIFVGHESSVDCVRFINGPGPTDGSGYPPFVATASSDSTVRIWSMTDAIAVRVFHGMKGWPTALAYRSSSVGGNEKLLACASTEGKIFIWDVDSGNSYQVLDGVLANDLQFSADGQYLLAGGDCGCFKIYRLSNGDSGNRYEEMQISENLLFHNSEAKFLKLNIVGKEIVALTA